jgi:hypothetical protein
MYFIAYLKTILVGNTTVYFIFKSDLKCLSKGNTKWPLSAIFFIEYLNVTQKINTMYVVAGIKNNLTVVIEFIKVFSEIGIWRDKSTWTPSSYFEHVKYRTAPIVSRRLYLDCRRQTSIIH